MDIQKCNDIYTKLYSLVIKEFELKVDAKLKEFELETWEQSNLKKYLSSILFIPILSTSKIICL